MISNTNQKSDHLSRKNIRVTDILMKSNQKINRKSAKRYQHNSIDYDTDEKKKSSSQSYLGDIQQMRAVIQSCESCMQKISQFTTKKPKQTKNRTDEKATQTMNKPFLIDLIQERVNQLCRQNRKLSKVLIQKQTEIVERQTEIAEIEDKFTNILYSLGQQISYLKNISLDADQLKQNMAIDTETPSYLKALMLEGKP